MSNWFMFLLMMLKLIGPGAVETSIEHQTPNDMLPWVFFTTIDVERKHHRFPGDNDLHLVVSKEKKYVYLSQGMGVS